MPFQVQPSTMANVVKGLYSLRPGELLYLAVAQRPHQNTGASFTAFSTDFQRVWSNCCFVLAEWAQLAPPLFSGFIPQINPPAVESLLSDYAAHDQKLQMELSMNGFPRSVWGCGFLTVPQ